MCMLCIRLQLKKKFHSNQKIDIEIRSFFISGIFGIHVIIIRQILFTGEISIRAKMFAWLIQNFYLVGFFGQKCINELWVICCHQGIYVSDMTTILIFVHVGVFMIVCRTTLMCTRREIMFLWRGKLTRTKIHQIWKLYDVISYNIHHNNKYNIIMFIRNNMIEIYNFQKMDLKTQTNMCSFVWYMPSEQNLTT